MNTRVGHVILAVLGISLLFLVSCTSSMTGIKPVYPEQYAKIKDLKVTLEWTPAELPDVTYDLIIWETNETPGDSKSLNEKKKREVYTRENIKETRHTVEMEFEPNKVYNWSVRTREGDLTGEWSLVETQIFTGITYSTRKRLFRFDTTE